ncbi:MAG: hypothetical protein AAFQ40_11415 [Cyanobacteria bacterium J06623_5]
MTSVQQTLARRAVSKRLVAKRSVGIGLSAVGLLLSFACFSRVAKTMLDPEPAIADKLETLSIGLLVGLPSTVGAITILRTVKREQGLVLAQRLHDLFGRAVIANSGRISAAQFAMLAGLSLDEAQVCLEAWADFLDADAEVDEAGQVVYCFASAQF